MAYHLNTCYKGAGGGSAWSAKEFTKGLVEIFRYLTTSSWVVRASAILKPEQQRLRARPLYCRERAADACQAARVSVARMRSKVAKPMLEVRIWVSSHEGDRLGQVNFKTNVPNLWHFIYIQIIS